MSYVHPIVGVRGRGDSEGKSGERQGDRDKRSQRGKGRGWEEREGERRLEEETEARGGGRGGERVRKRERNYLQTLNFFPNGLTRNWALSMDTGKPTIHIACPQSFNSHPGVHCVLEFGERCL